ncbi:ZIP family metal transporter [Candidatus Woesebacteria bacterium]|nr:ZIP family metal transporter [Candidatus Woesebacteria bacterium]
MPVLLYIITSLVIVSLISFVGVFSLFWSKATIHNYLSDLVALAAGTMLSTAFLHILPEASEFLAPESLFLAVLASFIVFFIVEKVLHWRHCHEESCETHTFGQMSLLGDAIHNMLDGFIIAGAFVVSVPIGVATTIAVIIHEIPQEIGNFGILLKAGYSRERALFLNFVVALTAVLGGFLGYFLSYSVPYFTVVLTPFAAGSFLYIAATDLLPQLQSERNVMTSVRHLFVFLCGVGSMYVLQVLTHSAGH